MANLCESRERTLAATPSPLVARCRFGQLQLARTEPPLSYIPRRGGRTEPQRPRSRAGRSAGLRGKNGGPLALVNHKEFLLLRSELTAVRHIRS
eukprot:15091306-Alexandrium_andersonii.AAC.1